MRPVHCTVFAERLCWPRVHRCAKRQFRAARDPFPASADGRSRAEAVLRGVSIARVVLERLGPPLRAAPETPVAAASDHDDAGVGVSLRP